LLNKTVEHVKNDPKSIISLLKNTKPADVYAIVLAYPNGTGLARESYSEGLSEIIDFVKSSIYDDQIIIYSTDSYESVLGGTFIMPFRYEDREQLVEYLNRKS